LRNHIEKLGKWPLEQSGKHRVNKNDEEFSRRVELFPASLREFRCRSPLPGHPRPTQAQDVDARDKPGHDDVSLDSQDWIKLTPGW
jgi:hypothetical protein